MISIGDIVTMKKFRWDIGVDRNWMEFKHPDKNMVFSFMFMGSEKLDGTEPLKYKEIFEGLGYGDLEKLEKQIIDTMRAEFEVVEDDMTGSATVPVKRVEIEDDGSYKVVLDFWPKDSIQLDHLSSHGEQIVRDAIRSGYDRGYNDARNAKSVPGDTALGYRGRAESEAMSGETLGLLRHISALNRHDDTLTYPKVRYLLEDCASYIDTMHAKHKTGPLEIGIDTDRVRQAASALNFPTDVIEGHVINLLESCDALALLMDKIGNYGGKLKYRREKLKELADLLRGRSALNLPADTPVDDKTHPRFIAGYVAGLKDGHEDADRGLWRFWNEKARSLATDNAALRKLIADNWQGQYWRGVNHDQIEDINSALNPSDRANDLNPINKAATQ